ncbi:unnamed protein product [Nezara viridula]|uniref:F-box domain-containing protein n=1 Tax=Nezara viridula TaxID=85310 RepID=A0A9P0HM07_NEZVI|nr:unnamed protein product [Nezara viridula]
MASFFLLPLELKEYIFKFLSGQDLWTCLSVSTEWRRICNFEKLWKNICHNESIAIEYFLDEEEDNFLTLCKYAVSWKLNSLTVAKWRTNGFKEHLIPYKNSEELTCRGIFTYKKMMALISSKSTNDNSDDYILQIHSFDKKSYSVDEITLSYPKPHAVTINNNYVIISSGNIVIIYKKGKDYKLYLGLAFGDDSKLYLATEGVPEFALLKLHTKPYVRMEALLNEYLWLSCLNTSFHFLYIVNLKTLQLLDLKITSRFIRVTRKYVVVSTNDEILLFTHKGELLLKLNIQGRFKATDEFIVTSPEQGKPLTIWTIKGKRLHVIPGPVFFELDPVRNCLYECTRNGEENCKLSAICLQTGACVWSSEMKKCRLSEIDDMYQVCDKFLIIDLYKETYTPNFHNAFVFDLNNKTLLYKTALSGYTVRVSKNLWVLKREDELIVQIY